jgi:hypothetical protein
VGAAEIVNGAPQLVRHAAAAARSEQLHCRGAHLFVLPEALQLWLPQQNGELVTDAFAQLQQLHLDVCSGIVEVHTSLSYLRHFSCGCRNKLVSS